MEDLVVYKNKRVLVTGSTGFKGSRLVLWLEMLGAKVLGYSKDVPTTPSLYEILEPESSAQAIFDDIRNRDKLEEVFKNFKPEIVFHLAAQPLVSDSFKNPLNTYETNVLGTLYTLEAAKNCKSVRAFVCVTTDKVYENNEQGINFKESGRLGGYDMYSSSKACCEILCASYRNSFLNQNFSLASARSGNAVGGGDWAKDRLICDCVKAFSKNNPVVLRNPKALRPWQHVLDSLYGYLLLGSKLYVQGKKFEGAYNFGPSESLETCAVVKQISKHFENPQIKYETEKTFHESQTLKLDSSKAKETLGWNPLYSPKTAIEKTAVWYKAFYKGKTDMYEYTKKEIEDYTEALWKKS